jgi:hypothetical protein
MHEDEEALSPDVLVKERHEERPKEKWLLSKSLSLHKVRLKHHQTMTRADQKGRRHDPCKAPIRR